MRLGHPFYDRRGERDENVRWSRRLTKGRIIIEQNAFGALEIYSVESPNIRIAITMDDRWNLEQCIQAASDHLEYGARARGVTVDYPGVSGEEGEP